ncbi:Putative NTF2-like domain superfamily protein [Septoria linicola]|uniref:NTF2-like domain superfamily protein n=1 Tax=Septoria linicola TaxID=215465 RepID=A0A9Q9AYM8_9PEZI|nr:putative NTF2-like domain superfamily protein [Septoria linicola]USW53051.1 Putative NTF2-like domain superfamily protein [Septoria linicola]
MLPSPSDSNASSPQKSSSGVSTTAQQLEQSIIDDVNAVNARDFSREGPLFRRKASYWVAEVTAGLASKTLTCEEFVEAIKARTTAHPNYKLRAIDFATTVDERNGHAEIFANMEVSGGWDGVVVPNVTVCEYHKIDGKWYHVAHRTMPGMDPNMLR